MIDERGVDYFAHGSDPCIVDGVDVYDEVRKMGKFMTVPRTRGISTTDIVGRLLLHGRASSSPQRTRSRPGGSDDHASGDEGKKKQQQPNRLHLTSR